MIVSLRASRRVAAILSSLSFVVAPVFVTGCGDDVSQVTVQQQARSGFRSRLTTALNLARANPGALADLVDDRHDPDDIRNGRIEAPKDDSELTQSLLRLVNEAEDVSEALLLVRLAGQDFTRAIPSAPEGVGGDPQDWVFEGYNVRLPYAVTEALRARKEARDLELDQLDEDALEAYEAQAQQSHLRRRSTVARQLGRTFDRRDDLYVMVNLEGEIWRRKKPVDHVTIDIDVGAPSSLDGITADGQELPPKIEIDPELEGGQEIAAALLGSDNRTLRSRYNGYSVSGNVWEPKGAIVDDGRSTNEVPVEVDCTGVKISERQVVTAGHCLSDAGSWLDNTKWIPGADGIDAEENGSDPSPNGYKNSYARTVRGNWFDHEWSSYDFGLFILYNNSGSCNLSWHGWRKRSGLRGDPIYLYGYPGERKNCNASPLSSSNCHGSIYGDGGNIKYAGTRNIRYDIDTQSGQSGTGFYEIDGGSRYVLGVHTGAYSSTRNRGVRISDGPRDMINETHDDYPHSACP